MTTSVQVYKSTDASAPSYSGTAGSLIALLDACLVNGYGSKTAAGWTKPYTGTNKAAFRMASGGPQMYMRIDDSGAQEARVVGYETMSDVDTGTGLFPTAAQIAAGAFWRKSDTANATARPWIVIANEKAFYLFVMTASTAFVGYSSFEHTYFFGVFPSYKSGDAYNVIQVANEQTGQFNRFGVVSAASTSVPSFSNSQGAFMCRAHTQTGTAILGGKVIPACHTMNNMGVGVSGGSLLFPDAASGALRASRIIFCEPSGSYYTERGYLPGAWAPLHLLTTDRFGVITGAGDLVGKTLMAIPTNNGSAEGRMLLEIDGTWGF